MKELGQRLVFGILALIVLVAAILLSEQAWFRPILGVAVGVIVSIGLWEYYRLVARKGGQPAVAVGIVGAWAYLIIRYFVAQSGREGNAWASGALFALIFFLMALWFLPRITGGLHHLATSIFGILYVAIPLSFVFDLLYRLPMQTGLDGRWWLAFTIAVTVATDAGAYGVGKVLGKHRLAPQVSPGKTWEGTLGGIVIALLIAWLALSWASLLGKEGGGRISLGEGLIFALCLALVGMVGDLVESLLKRDAEVKDSGNIPGLGGMLDVVDSLLFNLPLTYFWLQAFHAR